MTFGHSASTAFFHHCPGSRCARLDIVDIMHDNVFRVSFQQSIIDDDAVILFGQLYKITVDNAVERVLVAPEDLRASYLLQPLK